MTNHDDFDDLFGDAARSYNAPPATPRDAMWDGIAQARAEATVIPIADARSARRGQRWIATAAGIAAVLVVGIAIGRATRETAPVSTITAHSDTQKPVTIPDQRAEPTEVATTSESGAPAMPRKPLMDRRSGLSRRGAVARPDGRPPLDMSGDDGAFRLAVVEHLTRTEVLLTGFRAQARSNADAKVDAQFATLSRDLLSTTRLLLSRRSDDPVLTRLLQDLELVLMQLSQYAADGRRADFDAVNQSIEKRNVLPKLRSSIPAGTALSSGT